MISTILALLLAGLKALPELVSVWKQITQHMQEVDKANNEKSAIERLQAKKDATFNCIKSANAGVSSTITTSQTEQFRKNQETVSRGLPDNSNASSPNNQGTL